MSLLIATFVKKSHLQARMYFIFLKKRTKTNLKFFDYQIWTSVKRSEKQLPNTASFSHFFQLNCCNFRLKHCKRAQSYQNIQRNLKGSGATKIQKQVSRDKKRKKSTIEKARFLFFKRFLVGVGNVSFCQEECPLGYHSMKFRHFPDIS